MDLQVEQLHRQLETFLNRKPTLARGAFVARGAVVLGDVTLGEDSSVWYNAVLRGDINRIVIGCRSNIQDNSVVHLSDERPCLVGDDVTVGHGAILHACTVENEVLVGMGAVVLDGAVVGANSIVGARALVTQRMHIPPGSLVLGSPARVVRALAPDEQASMKHLAAKYAAYAAYCLKHGINVSQV
jgi:gamma-carbonic anhydrase